MEGLFVPGLAGPCYRQKAVEAARSLVRVVRYSDSPVVALEVGIGIASGEECSRARVNLEQVGTSD